MPEAGSQEIAPGVVEIRVELGDPLERQQLDLRVAQLQGLAEQTAGREKFIALAEGGKLSEVVETLIPRFLHRNRANDEPLKNEVRAMAAETGAEAFVRQTRAIMGRPDSRPLLSSIRCPTLVLVGEGDELTTPDMAKEIAGGIAGSTLTVVPDCGHLSTMEKPDAVNAALTAWLTKP